MAVDSGGGSGTAPPPAQGPPSLIRLVTIDNVAVNLSPDTTIVIRQTSPSGSMGSPQRMTAREAAALISANSNVRVVTESVVQDGRARPGVSFPNGEYPAATAQPDPTEMGGDQNIPEGPGATPTGPSTSGSSGGGGGSTGGGVSTATSPAGSTIDDDVLDFENATDEEIIEYVREELGFLAWMLDIPELQALVLNSLREGDSEDAIVAQLQNTEWWRTTEPQAREWVRVQNEDPAFANRLVQDVALNIRLEMMRLGLTLDGDRIEQMAREAIQFGWVDLSGNARGNLLTQAIFNEAKFNPQDLGPGSLAVQVDDLTRMADDYMITLSEDTAAVWAERIELGETDVEAFENYVADLSASRFPHLKGVIEQGISPRSHFEPYRQQIASLLEVSPEEVDLFGDPRFSDIVEMQTDQGVRAMTLAEAQKYVRKMPEWQLTTNALTQAARTGEALLAAFGESM